MDGEKKGMRKTYIIMIIFLLLLISGEFFLNTNFEYAFLPEKDDVVKYEANNQTGTDIWGKWISAETGKVKKLSDGTETPVSAKQGAIAVDKQLLQLGREVFYKETFGNEVFLTDIMGIVNGPLTMTNIAKAIIALKGKGTTNLQVELAKDITIGNRTYKKGEKIDTGIDVPKGSLLPLGMPVVWDHGKLRIGISCAACHATVDPKTKKVVEGAPNNDLNAGLLMALATNSAAYFTHADIKSLKNYIRSVDRVVVDSKGRKSSLPDPQLLEKEVDRIFASWPRGISILLSI